jgi:hypothetical protein
MQGVALVLEPGQQRPDALLIGPEGALHIGDLAMDHASELARPVDGMLDAADQLLDLLADGLGNGRDPVARDLVRPDQPQRRMHQRLGHVLDLLGAPQEIGRGPDQQDRQRDGDERRCEPGHPGALKRRRQPGADRDEHHHRAEDDPEERNGESRPERRCRRPAAQHRRCHAGAGVVLVGGPGSRRFRPSPEIGLARSG